jgi:phospholipid/cholesterol/gamma-HCH transport system ATP-binding protein
MEKSKISVKNLSKTFGKKRVLDQVNLEIAPEESVVIIGGSGSGKSVFIKTIMGLIEPDEGSSVVIDGEDVTHIPIIKRTNFLDQFGMLFQGGALFDSLKIWENVAFDLIRNVKMPHKQAKEIAAHKLSLVGLEHTLDLYPSELSGGMQKRAAMARAIAKANPPKILFFDEPTSGLDPITSQVIIELIASLSKELKATTITITHDMRCLEQIGDKAAMIYKGNIKWQGSGKNIQNSNNEFVDQFIHGRTSGPIEAQ